MRSSSARDLETCIDRLYGGITSHASLDEGIALACRFAGARSASYFSADPSAGIGYFVGHGHDPAEVQRFVTRYAALDPTRPLIERALPGVWLSGDELLHPTRSPGREYVNDFALRSGLRWQRSAKLVATGTAAAYFTVHRGPGEDTFEEEALRRLRRLQPHLARVAQALSDVQALLPRAAAGLAAFEEIGSAAFVVDGQGRVRHMNGAGDATLRMATIVTRVNGRLALAAAPTLGALEEAARQACSSPRRAVLLRATVKGAAAGVGVRIIPVDQSLFGLSSGQQNVALVLVDARTGRLERDWLRTMYGLSEAEIELVRLLAQGARLKDCASLRGISLSTARTQLASVLLKTDTASQAQLVARVLGSC